MWCAWHGASQHVPEVRVRGRFDFAGNLACFLATSASSEFRLQRTHHPALRHANYEGSLRLAVARARRWIHAERRT
jgi:hypothetical protein